MQSIFFFSRLCNFSDGDVVLYYTYGDLTPVLKRIPWFNDSRKVIQAICFDPTATWLLVVCKYIITKLCVLLSLFVKKYFCQLLSIIRKD